MANITVRTSTTATDPSSTSAKGSALSHTELDSNFILLNNEKLENAGTNDYTGDLQIKGSGGSTRGSTRFFNNDDSKYIELKAPATITNTTSFTLPPGDGSNGQALITNGAGALVFGTVSGGGSSTQSTAESNFQLNTNSNLDVNGNKIISTSNGDIDIEPNGTGDVLLGNFKFDVDQTVGASQDNMVLTYDNSTGKISLETNAATAGISNVVEDTSPELGGDLDILARKITSSSANVVISADATDKEVHIKVDDAGGTNQFAAQFRDYAYTENTTDSDSSTAATKHKAIMDLPGRGMRIGSTALEFSSTGAAPNNNNAAYNNTGLLITNGDEPFWPMIDLVNYGGKNPLLNATTAGGVATNFTSPAINFKAAGGTESSKAALPNTKRLGQVAFTGYDGSNFGGSGAIASASLTVTATEDHSTSNARGAKMVLDVLPTGGSASDGDQTSDRIAGLSLTGGELVINPDSKNLDFKVNGDTDTNIFVVDAGTQKTEIAGDGLKIADDTKINFGDDSDCFVRWRNSSSKLEANIHGNLEIKATDSGASNKGNVLIRADNKIELRAGTDKDDKGDLVLTSFDDFQFRKNGFASTDTDVAPTTNGTTSVTLSRSLTAGETSALADEALFFYDSTSASFSSSDLRDMDNYIQVTGVSGSGASTVLTLEEAVSNLSNATHSANKFLMFNSNSSAVVVDGTRGRLDDKSFLIQNRIGIEGPQDLKLRFQSVQSNEGTDFLGTKQGITASDSGLSTASNQFGLEEIPVEYILKTRADKNTFDLEHKMVSGNSTDGGDIDTTTTIFQARKRSSTTSTLAAGVTAPDMVRFNVDIDAEKYITLHNQGGAPSGVTNASHIYARDESSSSEVFVRDEAGNETKISPHNEAGEWEYYSKNIKTGKTVRVNMERMIGDIEKLTGNKYIENE